MIKNIIIVLFGVLGLAFSAWIIIGIIRVTFTEFMSDNPNNVRASVIIALMIIFWVFIFPYLTGAGEY